MRHLPPLFVSHGAPTFAIDPGVAGPRLTRLGQTLPRPVAVAVGSPHWTTRTVRVGASQLSRLWQRRPPRLPLNPCACLHQRRRGVEPPPDSSLRLPAGRRLLARASPHPRCSSARHSRCRPSHRHQS